MNLRINDTNYLHHFIIENNILKGVIPPYLCTYQVGEVLLNLFDSNPGHVSQIDAVTGRKLTFAEMRDLSVRCALWFRKWKIGFGDIVTLCSHNHLNSCIPLLATFYVGAVYNAWNCMSTLVTARRLMKLFQPKVIFACESVTEVLLEAAELENSNTKIIVFDQYLGLQSFWDIMQQAYIEDVKTFLPTRIKDPDQMCLIILSSSSSGKPKGVVHPYHNIMKMVQLSMSSPMISVSMWHVTDCSIVGFINTMQNIMAVGTRIIPADTDLEHTCQVIEKYKVKRAYFTPSMIVCLCISNLLDNYKFESLEIVITGGYKLKSELIERFRNSLPHVLLFDVYGMTEIGRCITCQTINSKNMKSQGFVGLYNQVKVVELKTGQTLGPNHQGELLVKSITMMLGYYRNPEATKEIIDDEGWLHTGDIVYYDDNGEIVIVDRLKEMIKYQHHHVSPVEIEQLLLTHPDVIEAAVVPIPHVLDGQHPMAFVKKALKSKVTAEDLVQLSLSLGEIKKLRGGIMFIKNLPKTVTGKIHRYQLKEMAKTLEDFELY